MKMRPFKTRIFAGGCKFCLIEQWYFWNLGQKLSLVSPAPFFTLPLMALYHLCLFSQGFLVLLPAMSCCLFFKLLFSIAPPIILRYFHCSCGIVQTGSFLEGAAPNGLFGLGMNNISVPSVLASKGLTANSFSMCFGPDGIGRMSFGDTGSSGQGKTPFNVEQSK